MATGRKSTDSKKGPGQIPLLEWLAASVGVAIALSMVIVLSAEALHSEPGIPPMMTVKPLRLVHGGGDYVLEVDVDNSSAKTGAAVQVEGDLKQGSATVESSQATIAYVPGKSHRPGGLVFSHDPRRYTIDLRVTGYERP